MSTSNPSSAHSPVFQNFAEFYPFYLSQHQNRVCRSLHVAGLLTVLTLAVALPLTGHALWLPLLPVVGYGFSWVGHFVFERNVPATFTWPWWSLRGDLRMTWETLTGQR